MKKMMVPMALVLSLALLAGCVAQQIGELSQLSQPVKTGVDIERLQISQSGEKANITRFASVQELREYIAQNSGSGIQYYEKFSSRSSVPASAPIPDIALGFLAQESAGDGGYSTTNVQIAGIDEADFVKTDGKYIYMIKNSRLIIVDAQDGKNPKIVFEKAMFGEERTGEYYQQPEALQMFVNGDRLAIFANVPKKDIRFEKYDIAPQEVYRTYTGLFVFDISDRTSPKLVSNLTVSGNYLQSRMANDIVYFVAQEWVGGNIDPPILYAQEKIIAPDMYHFSNPQEQYVFNTVCSFDISKNEIVQSNAYLMGATNTIMMNEDNLYIAFEKTQSWCRWCYGGQAYTKERFQHVMPILPKELREEIDGIETSGSSKTQEEKWEEISAVLKEYFMPAYGDSSQYSAQIVKERKALLEKILDELAVYDAMVQIEQSKTYVQRFSIKEGRFALEAQGSVPGHLLNQFSMDEYDGKLRVATTINVWAQKQVQYNNVYVLDSDMDIVGRLEKIAKDESIYSARFMGKRLYLVTYRQVDPFFAIDLSDAYEPKILGELKIPGYSSYLHPYSQDLIIGVGKQTEANEWGGVNTKGVKISLFNVADPQNPKEVDTMEFGGAGSDSAVLYDHKAFLLDTRKSLLVLPLRVVESQEGFFRDKTSSWEGAVVVNITESGFREYGLVMHSEKESYYGGWWSANTVQRSLYIGNVLYTVSDEYLKANEIANGMPEIASIPLAKKEVGILPEIRIPFVK